jgi:3-phosphoshikimate 1-carboxyvinyltransferase
LFPILAILAAAAMGKSSITGIHRLENKESNRLISVTKMLQVFNVPFNIENDTIEIFGKGTVTGGKIESFNDHRIAMAATIGACIADDFVEIDNLNCVQKSYPEFFSDIDL